METVYWLWGNRLRIHQVWGSLKLIRVDETSNLFLIRFFPLYMLVLKCLMPFKNPEQAESGLEMKWPEDSERLKCDGKGLAEVHRGMEDAVVFYGDT